MRMLLLSCTWFKNILFSLEELLQVLCWELDLPSALPSQSSQKEVKTQLLPVVFLSIIGSLIIVIIGSLFFIFVSCDAFPVDFPPLSLMYGTILLNTDPSYSQHLPSAWVFRWSRSRRSHFITLWKKRVMAYSLYSWSLPANVRQTASLKTTNNKQTNKQKTRILNLPWWCNVVYTIIWPPNLPQTPRSPSSFVSSFWSILYQHSRPRQLH